MSKIEKLFPINTDTDDIFIILESILFISFEEDNYEFFDSECCKILIDYCMNKFGDQYHFNQMKIYFLFLLLFNFESFFNIDFSRNSIYYASLVLCGCLYYTYEIFHQIQFRLRKISNDSMINVIIHNPQLIVYKVLLKHYDNVWNILNVIIIVVTSFGSIGLIISPNNFEYHQSLLSIASIFINFKILYFFRSNSHSGPLGEYLYLTIVHSLIFLHFYSLIDIKNITRCEVYHNINCYIYICFFSSVLVDFYCHSKPSQYSLSD